MHGNGKEQIVGNGLTLVVRGYIPLTKNIARSDTVTDIIFVVII
jgi:hypothetical protein